MEEVIIEAGEMIVEEDNTEENAQTVEAIQNVLVILIEEVT